MVDWGRRPIFCPPATVPFPPTLVLLGAPGTGAQALRDALHAQLAPGSAQILCNPGLPSEGVVDASLILLMGLDLPCPTSERAAQEAADARLRADLTQVGMGYRVVYGHGEQRIANALNQQNIPYIVAEQNRELVQDLRKQGINAVSGDATEPSVLIQAHITDAAMLVIATPDPLNVRQMIDTARTLNPNIEIVLRTRSEDETKLLRHDNMGTVFFGEEELAKSMTHHILDRFNAKSEPAHKTS